MKQFSIRFNFQGRSYLANVTEVGGLEDTQYAISPKDERLAEQFKTNIIRKPKDGSPYQYSFPDLTNDSKAYMEALARGLDEYLRAGG